jgi:hypothetical protein
MKVTPAHHAIAVAAFKSGKNTPQVQAILHKEGLTPAQANSACRTARKKTGQYKKNPNAGKQFAKRAKEEADRQATIQTEVDLDAND